MSLRLPLGTVVLIADGQKALVLRNKGDATYPDLRVERVFNAPANPPTHEQGTDKPPRAIFEGRRSAIEATDWHAIAKERFADEVAAALASMRRSGRIDDLVIVAPPRTLAELRRMLPDEIRTIVRAEIDKDLTGHTVDDIERHLTQN
jgi:protein required for attachment to host cells